MPELERYMLHLLADMDAKLKTAVNDFDFNTYVRLLTEFCNEDLSAFFFDIRKDCLYCDVGANAPFGSPKRMAYRTVLDTLFHALVRYAAPVLVFTSEEVWQTRFPDADSVHFSDWPEAPAALDGALAEKWRSIRGARMLANELIEPMRRNKEIGSSLEVEYSYLGDAGEIDLAEIFIVSAVHLGREEGAIKTANHKCGRCWRHLPEVVDDGDLCGRCADVVGG
jgi:isoleucyl-tRNA synthetase